MRKCMNGGKAGSSSLTPAKKCRLSQKCCTKFTFWKVSIVLQCYNWGGQSWWLIGLRIAHFRIAHHVANPEVGNPEIHRPFRSISYHGTKVTPMYRSNLIYGRVKAQVQIIIIIHSEQHHHHPPHHHHSIIVNQSLSLQDQNHPSKNHDPELFEYGKFNYQCCHNCKYSLLNVSPKLYISSWLHGWRLVSVGWMQCDLRWRKQNKIKGSHPAPKPWRRDVSGSGGDSGLQFWPMPRFFSHPAFWFRSSHFH